MIHRIASLLALLATSACVVMTTPEPGVPEGNWLLPGTTWKVVELDGAPFAATATATLTEDGHITGQAPCNAFRADYHGQWPDVTLTPVATTRMACPELDAESAFLAALGKINRGEMLSDAMLLTGPGASLRLVRI